MEKKLKIFALMMAVVFTFYAGLQIQAQGFGDLKKLKDKAKTEKPAKEQKAPKEAKADKGGKDKKDSPAVSSDIDNNIKFGITKDRTLWEKPYPEFGPGDWLYADVNKLDKPIVEKFNGKDAAVLIEYESAKKIIASDKFQRKLDIQYGYIKFNVIPDPDSTEDVKLRWDWSGKFAAALSKLPAGEHEITVRAYFQSGKDKNIFAKGNMLYKNKSGNGKMADIAKGIEKNKGFDIVKENEEFTKKHGRATDTEEQIEVTVYNNCGQDVVITYANQRTSGNHLNVRWLQSQKIVVSDLETVYIKFKGKSIISGPSIGSFEKGKTINLCK
jgi:hypothetical protein